jgi:hypothetical protein
MRPPLAHSVPLTLVRVEGYHLSWKLHRVSLIVEKKRLALLMLSKLVQHGGLL